ncbi:MULTISPECIES: hypothetical protein [Asaia]|uniref:Uncharacterized protein n=1 Tax=Asaia spathodeae TaxID=657016 RepID=A0ABX2P9M4_9PROT|nr:hypothetical protein [Asaia spathodeae]GBR20357.1 hypothetical protein AA105894_2540 [Asaia spathodeae NBRC 105894]
MTHNISGFNQLMVGAFVLAVSAAIVTPTHAAAKFKPAPCEKVAPKTTGPAWIHLTLRVEGLVSLRSGGPKNAPVQLPTTDIVAFDGYLPADGSDISVKNGRETAYVAAVTLSNHERKRSNTSVKPGSAFTGVSGTFHALPDKDGNIVVAGDVHLADDLAIDGAKLGNLSLEEPRFKDLGFQPSVTVAGLHCVAPVQERTGNVRSNGEPAGPVVGVTILAERTQ